jgi:hypothetical protein
MDNLDRVKSALKKNNSRDIDITTEINMDINIWNDINIRDLAALCVNTILLLRLKIINDKKKPSIMEISTLPDV